MFYISYIIIVLWFLSTNVIVEFQDVEFMSPRIIAPIILGLDAIQLGITSFYTFLYYKIKF